MRALLGPEGRDEPPARRRRWVAPGLLAVAALCLHGWLIDGLVGGRLRPAGVHAAVVQVRSVVRVEPVRPVVPGPVVMPVPPVVQGAAADSPGALPEPRVAATDEQDRAEPANPAPSPADAPPPGQAPPVYPTKIPAPVLLRYALRVSGQHGEASLAWRHDGQVYGLELAGRGLREQPLIEQRSSGGFDAAGLAPERFTDRRRGRGTLAANFRRDVGRISFSGPSVDYPAWPGAQDRLSWLVQAVAIIAATDPVAARMPEFTLFVVDARGVGELWRFVDQGPEQVDTALGLQSVRHWLREPEQLTGQRVEIWFGAAQGHWPVQLRFTFLRSAQVFELRLAAEPQAAN